MTTISTAASQQTSADSVLAERDVKYVFVCGLHRSGTTILAQDIGELKNCTAFENTGATMDEGQHLQDIYPPDYIYGGVGKFGFAPQAHLTEESPLLKDRNVSRLRQSWEKHWDRNKTIRIEKTPGNLLMTRFLQAAFHNSYFVVIRRHPVPVSLASQKWSRSSLHSLFEHWLRCYEIFEEDKKYLNNLYELNYEDYIKDPKHNLERIAQFIGTESTCFQDRKTSDIHNAKYFAQWAHMLQSSTFRSYYNSILVKYEKSFAAYGYSLKPSIGKTNFALGQALSSDRQIGYLLFLGADIYWIFKNAVLRSRGWARRTAKHYFPPRLQAIVRDCKATLARRST